ncbi:MAG: hypothetical protein JNL04_12995 [Rhodospirillaceae bacterium]|nr:hypothetical protein [Rhodospirillaceae bacterium]
MHGHTPWVSRERPDLALGAPERCWIDGDLIRLSLFPVGGIRPGVRGKPVPWLMDLAVLEEAMQEVYGRGFRLGDRAPLLQLAADALADGDHRRAAEIADAVAFPPSEFRSRFRDAGLRYLAWGPAHRRGNPRIDVDAWLARTSFERKYDPDQPRVPRGHPDGGQWTDSSIHELAFDPNRPISEAEWAKTLAVVERIYEEVSKVLGENGSVHLASAFEPTPPDPLLPPDPWNIPDELAHPEPPRITIPPGYPTPKVPTFPRLPDARPETEWDRAKWVINKIRRVAPAARVAGLWGWALDLTGLLLPSVVSYFDEPKSLEELWVDPEDVSFGSPDALADRYKAGDGYQLHHIVEQKSKSDDSEDIHSTRNVIRIPTARHIIISAHYSSKPPDLNGLTIRQWLRTQSYERRREYGLWALQWYGVMK